MDYSGDSLKCETLLRNKSMYRLVGHTTATYWQYVLYNGEADCKLMYNKLRGVKDWRTDDAEGQDFMPIADGLEFNYIRKLYGSIEDTFNRPITSSPDGWIDVAIRERTNTGGYFAPLQMTGETRRCLNLGSYNYLGFGGVNDYCTPAVEDAIQNLPISSSSTLAEQGRSKVHTDLEAQVARYLGKPAALVVGMGFGTNSLVIPALVGKGDLILSDAQNHKSIVEGARMSGASIKAFRHDDVAHLEHQLQEAVLGKAKYGKVLVIIEGIYSMEGELCSLPEIVRVCKRYKAYIYLDEAHSIGAVGQTGRGVTEEFGVDPADVDILMGTFTKSFGAVGGYVAASAEIVEQVRLFSAGCSEAVSMAPACCVQIATALRVMSGEDGTDVGQRKVQQLRDNSQFFREGLEALGLEVLGHFPSPVMPVMLYQPFKIGDFSRLAFEKRLAVVVVGAPAVSKLLPRVRFCLSAAHTREDLEMALQAISEISDTMSLRFKIHPPNPFAPGTIENVQKEQLLLSKNTAKAVALHRTKAMEAVRQINWGSLGMGKLDGQGGWGAEAVHPEDFQVHFSSADYLGLRGDSALAERCLTTVRRVGVGACSPRGFYGTFPEHLKLEQDIASFLGVGEAVLYSFGACTISSVIPSICKSTDVAVVDSGVGYGTLVGLRLAKIKIQWYKHCDATDAARVLEELEAEDGVTSTLLRKGRTRRCFIITEAVFQSSGQLAPLIELAKLRTKHKARIILEESCSFGCLGRTGRGLTEHVGLPTTSVDVIVASLEGAGASVGGFAAGASGVVNYQRLMATGYVFSAALPPYLATASSYAIEALQSQPKRLAALQESACGLWAALQGVPGICTSAAQGSPVLPLRLAVCSGDYAADRALLARVAREVRADGLLLCLSQESCLTGIQRQPGNLADLPSLRLQASAAHTADTVARFAASLRNAVARAGVPMTEMPAGLEALRKVLLPRSNSTYSTASVHTPYASSVALSEIDGAEDASILQMEVVTQMGLKAEVKPPAEMEIGEAESGEEAEQPASLTVPLLVVFLWIHQAVRQYLIKEIISTENMSFNLLRSFGALPSQGNALLSMLYTLANFMASRRFYVLAAPVLVWLTDCTQASALVLFYCFNCVVGFMLKSTLATLASTKRTNKVLSWPSIAAMNATGLPFFILRQRFGSEYIWEMPSPKLCALAYAICLAWLLLVTVSRVRAGDSPADVQGGVVAGAITLRVMALFIDPIQDWLESGALTSPGSTAFFAALLGVLFVFPLPVDLTGKTVKAASSCYCRTIGMLSFAFTFTYGCLVRAAMTDVAAEYHMATSARGAFPRLMLGFLLLYAVMVVCGRGVRLCMERTLQRVKGSRYSEYVPAIRQLCFAGMNITQRAAFGGAVSFVIPAVFDAIGV